MTDRQKIGEACDAPMHFMRFKRGANWVSKNLEYFQNIFKIY